jgi:hypothetical protein
MGNRKHACCEEKLTFVKGVGGERGYTLKGDLHTKGPRGQMRGENFGKFCGRIRNKVFPDACALDTDGNPAKFYDFKFQCEKGIPTRMKNDGKIPKNKAGLPILSTGTAEQRLKGKQLEKYQALSEELNIEKPGYISNEDCLS